MIKQIWPYSLLCILVFCLGGIIAVFNQNQFSISRAALENELFALDEELIYPNQHQKELDFTLVDPEMAPEEIRPDVMRGYRIVMETNKYAGDYTGDRLSCRNCHFEGGNTYGGKNGSISLVGVTEVYPRYSSRAKRKMPLWERINNCFMRSMNGKPLPKNSREMKAILAYLDWISMPVKGRSDYHWLGLREIRSDHQADSKNGKKIYAKRCAGCHLIDGKGTESIPPLWGPDSFNDGAGMNTLSKIAPFIHDNMPKNDPFLTEEEALDVGAHVIEQPRPKFHE